MNHAQDFVAAIGELHQPKPLPYDRLATHGETYELLEKLDAQVSDLAGAHSPEDDPELTSEIAHEVLRLTVIRKKLLDLLGLDQIIQAEGHTIWVHREK